MAGDSVSTLPRPPVLKGLHNAYAKKHLYIGIGLSIVGMFAYKFLVTDPKKRDYAEFYK